tara:strand:- start:5565 stop:6191 length:627 start_codon:yes stop_codon:yes gene_type:complete
MAFKMNPKSPCLKSTGHYATPQAIKPAVTSPTKQTSSQKKNLPEAIVKAIAAKSPAKQKVNKDDGIQVKEVPAVVKEEAQKAGKFVGKEAKKVGKWFKKITKKVGDIDLTKTKDEKIEKAQKKLDKLKTKKSPAKQKGETYAERQARLKREKKEGMARLAKVKAKREARNAADANKPKPKQQTRLQALKAKITSDLTSKEADKPRSQT